MPRALVALAVMVYVPTVVGVPVILPVVELIDRPAGRPVRMKFTGLLLAASELENALPAGPVRVVGLVIAEKFPIVRIRLRGRLLPNELLAVMGTLTTCGAVGVPLISPEEALRERPAGSPDAVKSVGLFVAVMVKLSGAFTGLETSSELVMAGMGPAGLIVHMMTSIAPWPFPLFALIDVNERPAVVGVPLIWAPEAVSPGGNWAMV